MHGQGELTYPNGSKYKGNFIKDKPNDENGKETVLNGTKVKEIFTGGFVNGQRHGKGTLYIPGQGTYEVEYENGEELYKNTCVTQSTN